MSEVLLEIRNLELRYGAAIAVRDISLRSNAAQLVAVIGNNGAGKSSMVRGATGLVRPSGGKVYFRGEDTTGLSADRKVARGLVMVPEGRLLFPDQTVEDNLILGAYAAWRTQATGLAIRRWKRFSSCFRASRSACISRRAACPAASSRCSPLRAD